jgi:hypothetical protein
MSKSFNDALDYLVKIEPDPASIDSVAEYDQHMAPHADGIAKARAAIRAHGEALAPRGLGALQDAHARAVQSCGRDALAASVVASTINSAWDGLAGWQK